MRDKVVDIRNELILNASEFGYSKYMTAVLNDLIGENETSEIIAEFPEHLKSGGVLERMMVAEKCKNKSLPSPDFLMCVFLYGIWYSETYMKEVRSHG